MQGPNVHAYSAEFRNRVKRNRKEVLDLLRGRVLYQDRHGSLDRVWHLTRRIVNTRHFMRCCLERSVAVSHHLLEARLERGGMLCMGELDGCILGDECWIISRSVLSKCLWGRLEGKGRTEVPCTRRDDHE